MKLLLDAKAGIINFSPFIQKIKDLHHGSNDVLTSFYVASLFTDAPVARRAISSSRNFDIYISLYIKAFLLFVHEILVYLHKVIKTLLFKYIFLSSEKNTGQAIGWPLYPVKLIFHGNFWAECPGE